MTIARDPVLAFAEALALHDGHPDAEKMPAGMDKVYRDEAESMIALLAERGWKLSPHEWPSIYRKSADELRAAEKIVKGDW